MLTVTPDAKEWITTQLSEAKAPDGVAMCLYEEEGQIQMTVGAPKEEDATFEAKGKTYLAVGPQAASKLQGKALCTQQTANGPSLAIGVAPPSE